MRPPSVCRISSTEESIKVIFLAVNLKERRQQPFYCKLSYYRQEQGPAVSQQHEAHHEQRHGAQHPVALVRETYVDPAKLIWPVFVRDDIDAPREIAAMPGQYQHTIDSLRRAAAEAAEAGVGAIDLFGVPARRDAIGSQAWAEDGILNRGLAAVRAEVGDALVVCADTCLDEFTDHGHCGLLDEEGSVDNDATLPLYQAMAISQARAGAHMVSPSGMMDGQVAAIRAALDQAGYADVAILAYSAKYWSACCLLMESVRSRRRARSALARASTALACASTSDALAWATSSATVWHAAK